MDIAFLKKRKSRAFHGLTEVQLNNGIVTITHRGNMGNTLASVAENVDSIFGKGAWDAFYAQHKIKEKGSPDYLYTLKVEIKG